MFNSPWCVKNEASHKTTNKATSTIETKKQAVIIIVNILIFDKWVNLLSTAMKAYNLPDPTAAIALGARPSSAAGSNKNNLRCYRKYCLSNYAAEAGIHLY